MDFTNREIVSYFWLAVVAAWVMRQGEVRHSLVELIHAFLKRQILFLFGSALTYIALMVFVFKIIGVWSAGNLKTTILWVLGSAFVGMVGVNRITDEHSFFSKAVRDIFAITGMLTFVVEFHSFGLLVEFVAVPVITLMGLLHVVSKYNSEHAPVQKLLGRALTIIGLFYLTYSCYQSVIEIDKFASVDTLREFGVPLLLSVAFLPFLYAMMLLFVYEGVFFRLRWAIPDERLLREAKWRAILTFGTKTTSLRRWARNVARDRPVDRAALLNLFEEARAVAKREANPQLVDEVDGWSPYAAGEFLAACGLPTRTYDRVYADEWASSSGVMELSDGILPNALSYYVKGSALVANELKLVLSGNDMKVADDAIVRFQEIGKTLLLAALADDAAAPMANLEQLDEFEDITPNGRVRVTKDEWSGVIGGFTRALVVTRGCQ